ncbi:MAG: hypothetical protein QXE64_02465 [Candidatus Pacearchaeota archaeon]
MWPFRKKSSEKEVDKDIEKYLKMKEKERKRIEKERLKARKKEEKMRAKEAKEEAKRLREEAEREARLEEELQKEGIILAEREKKAEAKEEAKASIPNVLLADIERLKAQFEALNEFKNVTMERFSGISESIGSLRAMIVDVENRMKDIAVEAEKAVDAVRSTKPEKLLEEVSKTNLHVDALKSEIDAQKEISEKIIAELKDLRDKLALFRNLEEILKLSKEMSEELSKYKKIQARADAAADKVESIFIEVNKRFSEFLKYKEMFNEHDNSIKELSKELSKQIARIDAAVPLESFESYKRENAKIMKDLTNQSRKIKAEINKFLTKKGKEIDGRIAEKLATIERAKAELRENIEKNLKENLDKLQKSITTNINARLQAQETRINELMNSVRNNSSNISQLAKHLENIKAELDEMKKVLGQVSEKGEKGLREKELEFASRIQELYNYVIGIINAINKINERIDLLEKERVKF